ncbi:hypothetical protein [Alloprevotella tannerae]|uniref:hypothetical protein n=1 Tax=Alloprevotella tannerae TaxID=76122 RepID=UPI0028D45F48|nr:hypothetical protein [Alloprevotella tannerae]
MKRKMKTNILPLLALTSLLFAACATDNVEPGKQKQGQEIDTAGMTAFSVNNEAPPIDPTSPAGPTTRAAGEYTGTGIRFYWTEYDMLGVAVYEDPVTHKKVFSWQDKSDIKDQLKASGKDRTSKATFWYSHEFTAPQCHMRYVVNTDYPHFNNVRITNKQEQIKPNDAINLGKYGDCGTATAYRQADGHYTFKVDHKASYITFLPYTLQKGVARAKIEKIKVTADKAVCGEFNFDDNGIDLDSRPATTRDNDHIELTLDNFPIPLTNPDANANAAIMVIAPGTYSKFTVEYTLHEENTLSNPGSDTRGTITKEYHNVTFTAGKNKVISQNLAVPEHPADSHYMWDALEGQYYWKGYEWKSPIPEQDPYFKGNRTHYPKDKNDPRWYREIPHGSVLPFADIEAKRSCKDCPNVNELCWYTIKGDAYWDNSLWVCMDHLYKGGHWIKKRSVIARENGISIADMKNASPDGIDHRKMYFSSLVSTIHSDHFARKPANIDNYFYLPDLGICSGGGIAIGEAGYYWSSTPVLDADRTTGQVYCLNLHGTGVDVMRSYPDNGRSIMWPTDR